MMNYNYSALSMTPSPIIKKKKKKYNNSIKYKIWLAIMATVLIVLITLWFLQVVFLEDYYQHTKKNSLLEQTQQLTQSIQEYGLVNSAEALYTVGFNNSICIDISAPTGESYVRYEALGESCGLHSGGDKGLMQIPSQNKTNLVLSAIRNPNKYFVHEVHHPEYDANYYTCVISVTSSDDNEYVILTTAPLGQIKEATGVIQKQLLYISIPLILITTTIAFLLARSVTKRIQKMSNAARQVAAGNLEADISVKGHDEISELSNSLHHMTKELSKVNVLQRELVANISHDMRTPLTMIRGYAETIRDLTGENKDTREHQLDIIIEESNRLTTLVSDVMDLSLMQAGQAPMNIKPFNLAQKASDILCRFELLEQTKGFTFSLNSPANVMVLGDAIRIEQVFYNLINNAINHIGEIKEITVAIRSDEYGSIRVEISDTGTGIAQEDLPLIWDRYYKPYKKSEAKAMGTGLGLSIVKAILINHNSHFGVTSILGKGSTFWFTLQPYNANKIAETNLPSTHTNAE